jgi:DNA-binding NtrC family response regulator
MTKRVLIVDDDRDMVSTLADILEMHGWETLRGYDGADAIRLTADNRVDAVVMDVRMPRVDGITALRDIRAHRPNVRVVLMTAHAGPEVMTRAEEEGALTVLKKPLNLGELLSILEDAAKASRPVLVIDDNPDFLQSMAEVLQEHGIATIQAATLPEALLYLQRHEPAAILLDLKLDQLDPRTNMLAIREIDPTVLLILYSGHPTALTATVNQLSPGAIAAAFTKPIPIDKLLAVLEGALSS